MKKLTLKFVLFIVISSAFLSNSFVFVNANEDNINVNGKLCEKKIQNIIENYYKISYDAYLNMTEFDLTSVLDKSTIQNQNKIIQLKEIIERWKYSLQKGYSKEARSRYPIYFAYKSIEMTDDKAIVYLDIDGDRKEAYPPFVSFGENKFILNKINSNWLISDHDYFDIMEFKDQKTKLLPIKTKEELHAIIDKDNIEIAFNILLNDSDMPDSDPYVDYSYNSTRAVNYANYYVVNRNTLFYEADNSDCTNFISQCVSYGYGDTTLYSAFSSYRMDTGNWSAGSVSGYSAWENATSHWNYMISSKNGLVGPRVSSTTWANLANGGVMQIDFDLDGVYTHTAICVSKSSEKFAQHTANAFRYYSDYSGNKRFYCPNYFREY